MPPQWVMLAVFASSSSPPTHNVDLCPLCVAEFLSFLARARVPLCSSWLRNDDGTQSTCNRPGVLQKPGGGWWCSECLPKSQYGVLP